MLLRDWLLVSYPWIGYHKMNRTGIFNSKVVCDEIVSQVKKSNMNFQLVETPFSLKLSIKKSPVKFYQNQTYSIPPPSHPPRSDINCFDREYHELKIQNENLETKNKALEGDLKCATDKIQDISEKNDVLESDLTYFKNDNKNLREYVKDLESEIKKFERSENESDIKEAKKLAADVEKKSAVIDSLKGENEDLKNKLSNAEKEMKSKAKQVKEKAKEIHDIKTENESIKTNLKSANLELKELKNRINREDKQKQKKEKAKLKKDFENNSESSEVQLSCDLCDEKFKSPRNFKWHKLTVHCQNQLTQTEVKVMEAKQVQTHHVQVPPSIKPDQVSSFGDTKCHPCNRYFFSESRLQEHKQTYHEGNTFENYMMPPASLSTLTLQPWHWQPPYY